MGYPSLRVLDDDVVARGGGFGEHGRDNMEIVSGVIGRELDEVIVVRRVDADVVAALRADGDGVRGGGADEGGRGEEQRERGVWSGHGGLRGRAEITAYEMDGRASGGRP